MEQQIVSTGKLRFVTTDGMAVLCYSLLVMSQLSTLVFQLQICCERSKARPAGHLMEAKRMTPLGPPRSQRTTSRQSPSVVKRKNSSEFRSAQSSCTVTGGDWAEIPIDNQASIG